MIKYSILKGIAAGTAQKFVSRNTEIDGYWALGKLYRFASENGSNNLTYWLWPNRSRNLKGTRPLAKQFENYVLKRLSQVGIKHSYVRSAAMYFEFGIDDNVENADDWSNDSKTWGKRFTCQVVIIGERCDEYKFMIRGWCAKHDPALENQSTRD